MNFNQFHQEKNVFTALAVVAFSGVAMANTVEVEKELVDIVKFKEGGVDLNLLNALLSNCK